MLARSWHFACSFFLCIGGASFSEVPSHVSNSGGLNNASRQDHTSLGAGVLHRKTFRRQLAQRTGLRNLEEIGESSAENNNNAEKGEKGEGGKEEGGKGEGKEEGEEGGEELEEEDEEEEEEVDEVSLTAAALLFGIVAFIATIFHLVNNKRAHVNDSTWHLLSDSLAIFCAVLWYQGVDAIFDGQFNQDQAHQRLAVGVLHFMLWYVVIQIGSFVLRSCDLAFNAATVLNAHLSGFACKDCLNTVMQTDLFRESVGMSALAVVLCTAALIILLTISYIIRRTCIYPKLAEEKVKQISKGIADAEDDMFALALSFSFCQVARFALLGTMPSKEMDEKDDHEQWQAWALFAFAIGCGALAVAIARCHFTSGHTWNTSLFRVTANTKFILVMTMAWSLLYWGQWEIYDTHMINRLLLSRIILALMISYFCMVMIVFFDFLADRSNSKFGKAGARLLANGFGLSVAFSWEAVFDVSVETISEAKQMNISEGAAKMLLAVLLVIIVGPVWAMYILPKSLEFEDTERKEEGLEESEEQEEPSSVKPNGAGNGIVVKPVSLGNGTQNQLTFL